MKTQKSASSSGPIPDFAPGPISKDVSRKAFNMGTKPTIERNKWFLVSCILSVALVISLLIIKELFPLKTIETILVNKVDGGRLVTDGTTVGSWEPDSDSIAYHLSQWVSKVIDINESTIVQTMAEAQEIAIEGAFEQLAELRRKENPLALLRETPGLYRSYEYVSLNFVKSDVAFIRFNAITRRPNSKPTTITYAMTITFTRVKPKTRALAIKNPAGLYIKNFNLTEESGSK